VTIETIFTTGSYRYDFDTQYGTSWFVRLKDDQVSLMNTGVDAEEEVDWVKSLNQSSKVDIAGFNSIAMEHSFSPRWSKEDA
jgi:hypothetical protein